MLNFFGPFSQVKLGFKLWTLEKQVFEKGF